MFVLFQGLARGFCTMFVLFQGLARGFCTMYVLFQGLARGFCMTSDIPDGYDEDFPNRVSPVKEAQNGLNGAVSRSPYGSKQQLVTADIEQAVQQTFKGTALTHGNLGHDTSSLISVRRCALI